MHIYIACSGMMMSTYGDVLQPRFCLPEPRFAELRSYFELRGYSHYTLPKYGRPFFLDSGAFSAHSVNAPIDLNEYIQFIKRYEDQLPLYCNLDAIPRGSNAEAKRKGAEETLANQRRMEVSGLKPLPVFHCGEPWEYLERYIEEYPHLCIGGLVSTTESVDEFLRKCWTQYLTDSSGNPIRKVHGFGLTTLKHLVSYPWDSVDSSTWLVHSKYGMISMPPRLPGGLGFDYRKKPVLLSVSNESSMKTEEGKHFDSLSPLQKDAVEEFVAEFGMCVNDLRTEPVPRMIVNIEYWLKVEQACQTFMKKSQQHEILL